MLLMVACSPEVNSPDHKADDVIGEAQAAFTSYIANLNRGDYDSASQIYDTEPGFHWIERGHIQYASGTEAAVGLKSFKANDVRAKMTTDQMVATYLSPTSVLISTHFDFAMLGPDENVQFSFDGWMSVAMVKRQDRWVFAAGQVGPGSNP